MVLHPNVTHTSEQARGITEGKNTFEKEKHTGYRFLLGFIDHFLESKENDMLLFVKLYNDSNLLKYICLCLI